MDTICIKYEDIEGEKKIWMLYIYLPEEFFL